MAYRRKNSAVYKAAIAWKERCLLDTSSVFSDKTLWTSENLNVLDRQFVQNPDEGNRVFLEKLKDQVGDDGDAAQLAAEMLWLLYLFPYALLKRKTKWEHIRTVWEWSGETLPKTELLGSVLDRGIGNPGQRYLINRPSELSFLITAMLDWRSKEPDEQRALVGSGWDFANWLDSIEYRQQPQFRHILLHLLFPKMFERIASRGDKAAIDEAFSDLLREEPEPREDDSELAGLDRRILNIRKELEDLVDQDDVDFYSQLLNRLWLSEQRIGREETLNPLRALETRKQIVLYGPPGTGKTFEARRLARLLIENHGLKSWGANYFRHKEEEWQEIFRTHIHVLQLHPAYSYEDFVRGLRIGEDLKTEMQPGYLLRLLETIRQESGDASHLPHVLVLDEINRADLSRLLGEVFSAFEYRENPIELSGSEPETIQLPEKLYVIGTMNLIDQSLELVDFALRRRFVWFEHTFSKQAAEAVMSHRWAELRTSVKWERIEPEARRLITAAEELNKLIRADDYLGARYEIGHTYFAETLPMVARKLERSPSSRKIFWDREKPAEPLSALWQHYLEPLLEQYLSGLETQHREERLREWRKCFLRPPILEDE